MRVCRVPSESHIHLPRRFRHQADARDHRWHGQALARRSRALAPSRSGCSPRVASATRSRRSRSAGDEFPFSRSPHSSQRSISALLRAARSWTRLCRELGPAPLCPRCPGPHLPGTAWGPHPRRDRSAHASPRWQEAVAGEVERIEAFPVRLPSTWQSASSASINRHRCLRGVPDFGHLVIDVPIGEK